MATDDPPLLVFLVAGESSTKSMRFSQGQAPSTTTVGLDGNWQVGALGVARAHISIFFDGKQLFASTHGPQLQATINGMPIDGRWWPVRAPAEVRFGQACLLVSVDPGIRPPAPPPHLAGAPPVPDGDPMLMTRLDGIAEWERRRRSGPPPVDPNATALYDPRAHDNRAVPPGGKKSANVPLDTGIAATERHPISPIPGNPAGAHPTQASAPPAQVSAPRKASSAPPADPEFMVKTSYAPLPAAPIPSGIPVSPSHFAPPKASAPPLLRTSYSPLPELPKAAGLPADAPFSPEPFSPAPSPLSSSVDRLGGAKNPSRSASKSKSRSKSKTKSKSEGPENAILVAWRSASLVKKITTVLLPVALIAVLLPESSPQRPAGSVRAATSATKPTGTAVASVAPRASTPPPVAIATQDEAPRPIPRGSPSTSAGSPGRSTIAPRADEPRTASSTFTDRSDGTRTADGMEHVAIDAAFEGRWQDALRNYDQLATTHPDNPAFAEAARIVRETKVNPR